MSEEKKMHEKLQLLLETARKDKKVASKDLIDALEAANADEKQTDLIYEALEAEGIEIDVVDVVELLTKPDELNPTDEELSLVEEEQVLLFIKAEQTKVRLTLIALVASVSVEVKLLQLVPRSAVAAEAGLEAVLEMALAEVQASFIQKKMINILIQQLLVENGN